MNFGASDKVRLIAEEKFVEPAIRAGRGEFSIAVKDLMGYLQMTGFPKRNWPQVCTAIQTAKFLRENKLEIKSVEGPPSGQSTTVVVRYRVVGDGSQAPSSGLSPEKEGAAEAQETPEEWAHRVTGKISGILKEELSEFGGGEAFIRWVRGYDEEGS